jgi:hypothetical protein
LSSVDPAADLAVDLEAMMAGTDEVTATIIEPDRVAVLWGVRKDLPYIVTAPGQKQGVTNRYGEILRAHDTARRRDPALP